MKTRRLITVADDFGLSVHVNEAVEQAARNGILTSASLMVAAPAAADAVRRAHAMAGKLHVGLHVVTIEGAACLAHEKIPDIVGANGAFGSAQLALSLRYAVSARARRQLAAEIRAQFEAFRETGLTLDHANAHKHMQLHPVIGQMIIDIGRDFGLRALRIPAEPPTPGVPRTHGDRALYAWTRVLRAQAKRAGLITNDHILGLGSSGHMTPALVQRLIDSLPEGLTELYFHPATESDPALKQTMPGYEHTQELAALLTARVPENLMLTSYSGI